VGPTRWARKPIYVAHIRHADEWNRKHERDREEVVESWPDVGLYGLRGRRRLWHRGGTVVRDRTGSGIGSTWSPSRLDA
jgi:hypothetical protein